MVIGSIVGRSKVERSMIERSMMERSMVPDGIIVSHCNRGKMLGNSSVVGSDDGRGMGSNYVSMSRGVENGGMGKMTMV